MTANPVLCRWKNQTWRNKVCLQTWLWCAFILMVLYFLVCICVSIILYDCVNFLFPSLKAFCTLTSPAGIEYITLYVVTFCLPHHLILAQPLCVFHYHPLYSSSVSTFSPFPPLSLLHDFPLFLPHHYVLYLSLWVLLIYSTVPYFFSYAFLFPSSPNSILSPSPSMALILFSTLW